MSVAIWAFVILLALMTISGAAAFVQKKKTTDDYLIASRGVAPWLSALSAVSTNNSGFMFIGMIAYTYERGIESMWMMVGWVFGDLLVWLFVHPRVRSESERQDASTLSALIGRGKSGTDRAVVVAAGLITFAFLGVYAAGQLKAGSTALHALFGWEMWVGALIGTGIVILYSFAGGIRADIWTDAAQSLVMIVSMVLILVAGYMKIGGGSALLANLEAQDPALITVLPSGAAFGTLPFVLGFVFAGIGVAGQPHLMARLMALDSVDSIKKAGVYYFAWYVPFFVASIGVGLYCRAIIPELESLPIAQGLDAPSELALPLITMRLLPDVFVGVALAGLFAATISTADSQIIVCSGALTQDVQPRWEDSYAASKAGTFSITAIALAIALFAPEGVFGLVLIAWSAMGASLGPVLFLRVFGCPLSRATAIAMMVAAIAAVTAWHLSGFDDDVYKILPGMAAAMAVYGGWLTIRRFRDRSAG